MEFVFRRSYRGPIKLAVLDWAGTTTDYGCNAPAVVFQEPYRRRGVEISMEQARRPMGLHKREHIRAISRMDEVAGAWKHAHGRPVTDQDIRVMTRIPRPCPGYLRGYLSLAHTAAGLAETADGSREAIRTGSQRAAGD